MVIPNAQAMETWNGALSRIRSLCTTGGVSVHGATRARMQRGGRVKGRRKAGDRLYAQSPY